MVFDRNLLFYFVRDALAPYSENFRIIDRQNPVQMTLNGVRYSTHVSCVHDSGNARENDDEVRIQLGRGIIEEQRRRQAQGDRVAFIGFFDTGDTFVAWDPHHIFSLETNTVVSVYARQSQRISVSTQHAAVYQFMARKLGKQSFAIALPASALGFYLENVEHFHALRTEHSILNLVGRHAETFADAYLGKGGEIEVDDAGKREKFTFERTAYPRDPRFKKCVLEAYGQTCCVCDRQLAIVQAAHIIPHSVEGSQNHVTNGLALCIEHHRLYDDALLLPGPGYRLVFNRDRAEYLRQTNQDKGIGEIRNLHERTFAVPADRARRPRDDYLQRGLDIRMGA